MREYSRVSFFKEPFLPAHFPLAPIFYFAHSPVGFGNHRDDAGCYGNNGEECPNSHDCHKRYGHEALGFLRKTPKVKDANQKHVGDRKVKRIRPCFPPDPVCFFPHNFLSPARLNGNVSLYIISIPKNMSIF